jgi:hypothetical protein
VPVATKVPDDTERRHQARTARLSALYLQWDESSLTSPRLCGKFPRNDTSGHVQIKASGSGADRRAGISGLMTCGSVWACPSCSHTIAASRAGEVTAAIEAWQAQGDGYRVALATLTLRHRDTQKLAYIWSVLGYGWEKVTSGRGWLADGARYGSVVPTVPKTGRNAGVMQFEQRIPFVRVVEATFGRNGWHLHIHSVLFLGPGQDGGPATDADCARLQGSMYQRWSSAVAKDWCRDCKTRTFMHKGEPRVCPRTGRYCRDARLPGMSAPSRARGVDVKLVDPAAATQVLGDYFTKAVYSGPQSAGFEATMGQHKQPKNGNRTPFAVLADVAANGEVVDLELWHEWEQASKGRRQLTWSDGLRDFLGLDVERTDQELAEDDSLDGEVLVELDTGQWSTVRRRQHLLRDAAEVDDTGLALYALLADLLPLWNRDHSVVNSS